MRLKDSELLDDVDGWPPFVDGIGRALASSRVGRGLVMRLPPRGVGTSEGRLSESLGNAVLLLLPLGISLDIVICVFEGCGEEGLTMDCNSDCSKEKRFVGHRGKCKKRPTANPDENLHGLNFFPLRSTHCAGINSMKWRAHIRRHHPA